MAPTLPSSLSPHIAILSSTDLDELLKSASLPSLPHILQSFSPLPQVTTRTTALVSVPHTSFALRFSDLLEIEEASREQDDQRAERTLDWITARITHRSAKWVQDLEKMGDKDAVRTPWWDELRRCVEGDLVPSKFEAWNHPVALILAVSTTAPNPLQAITTLHSRTIQFPPWVDTNFLRYTVIIHPQGSSLSDEEATALYNAVKKQFGLHSYLLPLALPRKPLPPPVPVPALLPRLPPPPTSESAANGVPPTPIVPTNHSIINTICMAETDIQQTARFTREFVVMSLVPWMEKCVLEWNENFSSTRRLPSRLFSSTRRLFGTPSPSPSPTPVPSSGPARSLSTPAANGGLGGPVPPPQIRRLAEFATVLGDIKLATTVWETLRKESKGGSDILPLLLTPTVATKHYAQSALMSVNASMIDLTAHEQMRVLLYAARWEGGIATRELLNDEIEGERWLVWAASNAEEVPAALLLAQAALLSTKKHTWRKAALWYFIAANRLEKCGIKPLTMHFLVKARELYSVRPQKELSPSFWNSEGKSSANSDGLENIMSGIEHPLGRLLYTTGDVSGAVKIFLGLLRGSSAFLSSEEARTVSTSDKVYIDDFRVAFSYLKSMGAIQVSGDFELPFKICVSKHSRPRYPGDTNDNVEVWSRLQDDWKTFWKTKGDKETLSPAGNYSANELFWVDLKLSNPLDVDVPLTNLTLLVQDTDLNPTMDFVEVESIKEVLLHAKESIIIPISLKSTRPAKLGVTHAVYDFLSLMPTKESLARQGRRLHDTLPQRQSRAYAPDTFMSIEVLPSDHRLTVKFANNEDLRLIQGENRSLQISLLNSGSNPISEIWMIASAEDDVWVGTGNGSFDSETKIISSSNSLSPRLPQRLQTEDPDKPLTLQPGESTQLTIILRAESSGTHELYLMFVFRKDIKQSFFSTRLSKPYHIESLFDISAMAHPSSSQDHAYTIELELMNMSSISDVHITDIVCVSPQWKCQPVLRSTPDHTISSQCSRLLLQASPWLEGKGSSETFNFVLQSFNRLLKGTEPDHSSPPPIDLLCSSIFQNVGKSSMQIALILNFIHGGRRRYISGQLSRNFPSIPSALHPTIFPLYNPAAVDFVFFWEIPSQNRSGHANLYGVTLGAKHGLLEGTIENAERAKGSRNMYAETRRENMQVMESIRHSEWNHEMNPLVLSVRNSRSRTHDFSTGPCNISVEFLLRNHSLTLPAKYTLRLQSGARTNGSLPAMYTGRPIFRGELGPCQVATVWPHLWVTRPGTYSLGGWSLETEILVQLSDGSGQRTRKRNYLQRPSPSDNACIVVYDSPTI